MGGKLFKSDKISTSYNAISIDISDNVILPGIVCAYYDGLSENLNTDECSICSVEYKPGVNINILPCNHNFHRICINQWITQHKSCPNCRKIYLS